MTLIDLGSRFFTWAEVMASQTASRLGINNTPDAETQATIVGVAKKMDILYLALGVPIIVSSWYRSLKLNTAIGSKPSSQHVKGEAVDFTAPTFGDCDEVFEFLKERMEFLNIDQLIREFPEHANGGWIHVSFSEHPRHVALIIDKTGARTA